MSPHPHDDDTLAIMLEARACERRDDLPGVLEVCRRLVRAPARNEALAVAERLLERAQVADSSPAAAAAASVFAMLSRAPVAAVCPVCRGLTDPDAVCTYCGGEGGTSAGARDIPNVLPSYALAVELWWPRCGALWVVAAWLRDGVVRSIADGETLWSLARHRAGQPPSRALLWAGHVRRAANGLSALTALSPPLDEIPACACVEPSTCPLCVRSPYGVDERCPLCASTCPADTHQRR